MVKVKRNEPCPCGSGKKYKKCCFLDPDRDHEIKRAALLANSLEEAQSIINQPDEIYTIKVDLLEKCGEVFHQEISRTFEIPGRETLYDLHWIIQTAFGWDNDHLYSFYMSNKLFDRETEYSGTPDGDYIRSDFDYEKPAGSAAATELRDLNLSRGQVFLYLFDYGDMIIHEVRVESSRQMTSDDDQGSKMIDKVGIAPDQYPYVEE